MARIPLPARDEMNDEQKAVHDQIVSGPRGRLVGPLRAIIHSPDLAQRWSRLGEYLRYGTCLPPRLSELAILVTGRRWNSQVEFQIHGAAALAAGLGADIVEAIRTGQPPTLGEEEDEIYEFARQLQQSGAVETAIYQAVERRWGVPGVVELTALVGYYTMVSMTLNVHEIPLPDEGVPPLGAVFGPGLTTLPPGRRP